MPLLSQGHVPGKWQSHYLHSMPTRVACHGQGARRDLSRVNGESLKCDGRNKIQTHKTIREQFRTVLDVTHCGQWTNQARERSQGERAVEMQNDKLSLRIVKVQV